MHACSIVLTTMEQVSAPQIKKATAETSRTANARGTICTAEAELALG